MNAFDSVKVAQNQLILEFEMTHIITANSVNEALSSALRYMEHCGIEESSRNGFVLVAPEPVITEYRNPMNRVVFSPLRNANPFFHLMEALWMLDGRNDLAWPMFFNKRFAEYSDDGEIIHGAYGYRWRNWFERDQLKQIVEHLKLHPNSRRAVLTMWDGSADLGCSSKDVPCNTQVYFDLRQGDLNMTVCCRSNDLWWGAYGANVVHFSILQEYLAAWLAVPIGVYRQFSNNFHLYTEVIAKEDLIKIAVDVDAHDNYSSVPGSCQPHSLRCWNTPMELWDHDLRMFLLDPYGDVNYQHNFFNDVAAPMYAAWYDRKNGTSSGILSAQAIGVPDWRVACVEWIVRADRKKDEHEKS